MENTDQLGAALTSILRPLVAEAVAAELAKRDAPKPLTRAQLAERLQLSTRQIDNLRKKGMPCIWAGDCPRFIEAEVIEWMRGRAAA